MLSEHSIAQSPRAQYGTIRVKVVRLLPKMYKFSARRVDEGSGLHDPEFPHHIHGRVQCLHLLHVLPAHRVLFPVLEAEHQRADSPARASHTHGLDSESGFWIRIRILDCIGLDSGRNSPQPAAICIDALSSALSLYSDSDSGFGFGLDWITDAFAIHLLSFAIICCHLLSGGRPSRILLVNPLAKGAKGAKAS